MKHKTLAIGISISILLSITIALFKYYNSEVLSLETRWLLVIGFPILVALFAGGYLKKFKGFGIEVEAKEQAVADSIKENTKKTPCKNSMSYVVEGLAMLLGSLFAFYVVTIIYTSLGWLNQIESSHTSKLLHPLYQSGVLCFMFIVIFSPLVISLRSGNNSNLGCPIGILAVFVAPSIVIKLIHHLLGRDFFSFSIENKLGLTAVLAIYALIGLYSSAGAIHTILGEEQD